MYTTIDAIDAIVRLYKAPLASEKFEEEKYTVSPPIQEFPSQEIVQSWPNHQSWPNNQSWPNQTPQFEAFIHRIIEELKEFSVSPMTPVFIYSVN
jgi:hypothetical protein